MCQLPTIIADNAGYDSAELIAQMRAAHAQGKHTIGLGEYIVLPWITQKILYYFTYCMGLKQNVDAVLLLLWVTSNIFFFLWQWFQTWWEVK